MDIASVVDHLVRHFQAEGERFATVGGFALLAHGIQRTTFDLDFVVEQSSQNRLVAFLEELGYETLHRSDGFSNHLHADADLGRLDFVYVDPGTARELFGGAKTLAIADGIEAPVVKPEHLAAMKLHALLNDPSRKHQDLADIRSLLHLPGVDVEEIRRRFEMAGLAELFEELEPHGE